jgi:hypothetical protein
MLQAHTEYRVGETAEGSNITDEEKTPPNIHLGMNCTCPVHNNVQIYLPESGLILC